MKNTKYLWLILPIALLSCNNTQHEYRARIDLSGQWQFALDTGSVGIEDKWYLNDLSDAIKLPGTTDSNQKGFINNDTTTMHLNRVYQYYGPAWYRKKVVVPPQFADKHIELFLERTKPSKVWIDSILVGESRLLQSPQHYDVSPYLSPGEHHITVEVNNDLKLTPYGNVHIYSDDTQTNWNGIIGQMFLEASSKTFISDLQVYPDIDKKKINVELGIDNQLNLDNIDVELFIEKKVDGTTTQLKPQKINTACRDKITLEYALGEACSLWDDYDQPLYQLTAVISNGDVKDSKTVPCGMRKFSVNGTQFTINGRTTFLRGKHDACVFPLTGFPPATAEGWVRVFRIAKSYGINHYRFHSYCPPEAAFTAADQEGMFLQAELPFWGGLESDTLANMLLEEGKAMLKSYANHPSFVMFSHGNEIWSGHDRVEKNILALKAYDNRPLYTMGSNNNIGYVAPRACSDFFVAARTPYAHDTTLTHTRLTHAFADSRGGGILNTETPSTEPNFDYAVSQIDIPMISHEVGQYQIFPDYDEITKYTGVLHASNLEKFHQRLIRAGMASMDSAFQKASGAWSAQCYKAEMEAALRTKGLAGFQLLDLQDFPGQGTALVGILDAFMDSKNVITPAEWKQSCNDVVLLLEFPKYCWTNAEQFQAKAEVANYSNRPIHKALHWEIKKQNGTVLQQGTFSDAIINNGGLTVIGEIKADLSGVDKAEKLTLNFFVADNTYSNAYPLWVYPANKSVEKGDDILIAKQLNKSVLKQLEAGANVLLLPRTEEVKDNSFPGLFPPDFWNYEMFKGISEWVKKPVSPGTLGLLTDPEHPLFNNFPTDFHTDWQWFSIIKASNSFILDDLSHDYYPIVQVIDNLQRNHKLGLIFELKAGNGKLLVCMSQLDQILDKPEAAQLYQSIINYMGSDDFNPAYEISDEKLTSLF